MSARTPASKTALHIIPAVVQVSAVRVIPVQTVLAFQPALIPIRLLIARRNVKTSGQHPAYKTERLTILPAAAKNAQAARRAATGHVRAMLRQAYCAVMIQEAIVVAIHIAGVTIVSLIVVI